MKNILFGFAVFIAIAFISYSVWNLKRIVHYNISYKSMVEQTVRDMVKPEALK